MKLIIDISEETYDYWKNNKAEYVLAEAIAKGIVLPEKNSGKIRIGRWMRKYPMFSCSECGCVVSDNTRNTCPECWAIMIYGE